MTRGRPLPRLHVVTDDQRLARPDFAERARAVLAAGGERVALHLRGHRTTGARMYALAVALRAEARARGALLIANDRVDVACAADLDGAHLSRGSIPAAAARRQLGDRWLGASVHGVEAARAATGEVDYLVVGALFATSSHPGRPAAGPGIVARVAAAVPVPLIAIGGVKAARVGDALAAGAAGVAVLSGVWDAADPGPEVIEYLRRLPEGPAAAGPRRRAVGAGRTVDQDRSEC